jgi:hypothetical protein
MYELKVKAFKKKKKKLWIFTISLVSFIQEVMNILKGLDY